MLQRWFISLLVVGFLVSPGWSAESRLTSTDPLGKIPDDIVAVHQQQIFDYLNRRIAAAQQDRDAQWQPDFTSSETYAKSLAGHRDNCRKMLGLGDQETDLQTAKCDRITQTDNYRVDRIAIPTDAGLNARGLLLQPQGSGRHPLLVVCPDATAWPEQFAGLMERSERPQWLVDLVARGCAIYLPQSVERLQDHPYCKTLKNKDRRMILYRLSYLVGRTMPGLDVQEVTAALDWLCAQPKIDANKVAIAGIGQGGMTALWTAAIDRRIAVTVVADYFDAHNRCCDEPVDRRLPGQLLEFGDAELAGLIAPRPLWIVHPQGSPVLLDSVIDEVKRAARFYDGLLAGKSLAVVSDVKIENLAAKSVSLAAEGLGLPKPSGTNPLPVVHISPEQATAVRNTHFEEKLTWLRKQIEQSETDRERYSGLTSCSLPDFLRIKGEMLRDYRKLIGHVPTEATFIHPRSELAIITDKYKGYRVMLDVAEGMEVYGHLLVPRNIKGRTAAVICQHGLNGFPDDITGLGTVREKCYHEFGRHLAERGYVVFAPLITHHYLPYDQPDPGKPLNDETRLADAVGLNRIAMVAAKTQRVIDFLQTLPFVDGEQIGYYGLSYGGHSAIWTAPLVDRLAVTVVSGNFNDQCNKLTSDVEDTSYLKYPYEDPYAWDTLRRFTHPELLVMTAPRVTCVEFGRQDGITTPNWTERAWKQTAAMRDRLRLTDQIILADFDGEHEIHGIETFDVLDRWLRPAQTVGRDYQYDLLQPQPVRIMGALLTGVEPFVLHALDARPETRLAGCFWIPEGAQQFQGIAVKLSRVGHPGSLEARFGSAPGRDDLGAARLDEEKVLPLFESFEELRVAPKPVHSGQSVYYELRATGNQTPSEHFYYVYGPKPLGGNDWRERFGLAYRVLTDRPEDALSVPGKQPRFYHIRQMLLTPYYQDEPSKRLSGRKPCGPRETEIGEGWSIDHGQDGDGVLHTAADDLRQFLAIRCGVSVRVVAEPVNQSATRTIAFIVGDDSDLRKTITTEEGYRVDVQPEQIVISAISPRGVMRGVYWIEEMMRFRNGPCLAQGTTDRNCRFRRRITRSVHTPVTAYEENSHPLAYSDALLQHISHQGFNAIWIWTNIETMAMRSKVFPELDDPDARANYTRLNELIARAKPLGIDVCCHLATNHHRAVPEWFYEKHPDCRGVGFANSMCTSSPQVREYLDESIRHLFQFAPGLKGVELIYDCEGFMHCGLGDKKKCPRCRDRKAWDIIAELLTTIHTALKEAKPDAEMFAWSYRPYGPGSGLDPWVPRLLPLLPKGIIVQFDFSRRSEVAFDGIKSAAADYNISTIGPPRQFIEEYDLAKKLGLRVSAKTEHAISQEFVTVPYIPCLRQWHDRCEKMAEYDLDGIFANWLHYGYTPSRPAEILMWYSWSGAPPLDQLLSQMAQRDFGDAATPYMMSAWEHVTRGIQQYPYSGTVATWPGPIQKGPSQPLFLDPSVKSFGYARAWQNDLAWTDPWGPALTARQLRCVEKEFQSAMADLQKAREVAEPLRRPEVESELRLVEIMCRSVHAILNLIEWIPIRDAYGAEKDIACRDELRKRLIAIGRDELANARDALRVAEADSRIGASSEGNGLQRGGCFTPSLISTKIGMLEDVLERQLNDLSLE